jgi:hypothetical protein
MVGGSVVALAAAAGTATEIASAAGTTAESASAARSAAIKDCCADLSHGHRLSPNP